MSNLNYCLGMLDLVDETNIEAVKLKMIKMKESFTVEELVKIITVLTEKYHKLAIYKPIKNLFEEFNISFIFFIKNDCMLHAYIRSLANSNQYKKIISFYDSIDLEGIKKFKSEIVRNISRAFALEGELKTALEIINTHKDFKCEMMKLFILSKKDNKSQIIKNCIILREKYNSVEEETYLDFWLAEIYFEEKNLEQLKEVTSRIRNNIYRADKIHLATRSLLMYDFLIFTGEEVRAYSFLKHLITHKCLNELEVENKIKAFKILINKYNFNKEELIKESSKYETVENFFTVKIALT